MNLRDTSIKYLKTASQALQIPLEMLKDTWSHGKDVLIPTNVHLGLNHLYPDQAIFIHSGIVREYFVDDHEKEHTFRFIQKYNLIAPPLNSSVTHEHTELLSETLTPIDGRIWNLDFMIQQAKQNPLYFRSIISIICEASYIKRRNDIRLSMCNAKERYLLFLNDFPGVVNQVPLKHVSSYLKMTPETISRVRTELSK